MDCDDSLCVDPDKLENYLHNECELRADGLSYDKSAGKPVKALVVAHIFGNSADMERLCEICQKYNLILIEDAAEAVGTFITSGKFAGRMLGTIGDYGAFSFNGNKIITTGGGGIVTSSSPERTLHMRHLAAQAKTDGVYYLHDEIGYNYRMTNVQAAIGLAQLELLEEFIKIKHTTYNLYVKYGADLLPFRDGQRPNYWFYSYLCPPARSGDRCASQFREITYFRDGLIRRLKDNGIQTRPVWGLCCEQPMYRKCRAYMIERAPEYGARIVNLPCGTNLAAGDVRLVMDEIKTFCADYGETNATSG
jgi:dTDP-4-amino-4,6-dideoxygalactose transaminase